MAIDLASIFFILFTSLFCILIVQWLSKIRKLPPGPWGLPILGYLPFLKQTFVEEQFKELSEKYGEVFGFNVGQQYVVVLSSYDTIKEAFIKKGDVFAGRPNHYNHINMFNDYRSVSATEQEASKLQRRFILTTLKDFGFGKQAMDERIQEEAEVCLEAIRNNFENCQDLPSLLNLMTTNVISALCFGQRFQYNNEKLHHLVKTMDDVLKAFRNAGIVDAFPTLAYYCLPDSWTNIDVLLNVRQAMWDFMENIIEEHIQDFDPNNLRDLTDMYLKKRYDIGLKPYEDDPNSIFSRKHMLVNLTILFFAGTDTTASTLLWAFKLLVLHPEVQKKVQEEIDSVVGRSRLPNWNDRNELHYTEATLLEVQRMASLVPTSLAHSNIEEATIKGFTIPKRSIVLMNIWQVHYDPKLWENPEKFDPTRFLNKEGKVFRPEYLIPFSLGKRICLGESLARMELLIFFASIVQNFTIKYKGKEPLKLEVLPSAFRKVAPFAADFQPR